MTRTEEERLLAEAERHLLHRPGDPQALYQRACALNRLGRPAEAWEALEAFPDDAPLAIRLERGHALVALDRAADALPDLVAVAASMPEERSVADLLVRASLTAGEARPMAALFVEPESLKTLSPGMLLFRAVTLRRLARLDDALRVLAVAEKRFGPQPPFDAARSDVELDLGAEQAALLSAERANAGGWDGDLALPLARALIASGAPERAHGLAEKALSEAPVDQLWLAHRITAALMLGRDDPALAPGITALARPFDLVWPEGFADELRSTLNSRHARASQPVDQSLRGGTQTSGALHREDEPVLAAFFASLTSAIDSYIAAMPDIAEHPMTRRRSQGWTIAGSWSVRLASSGHHVSHIHPGGWISAAAYVDVPEDLCAAGQHAGHLALGAPPPALKTGIGPQRLVKPKVGRVALFPSYLWHGTVPFEAASPRLTIAFDVVPA